MHGRGGGGKLGEGRERRMKSKRERDGEGSEKELRSLRGQVAGLLAELRKYEGFRELGDEDLQVVVDIVQSDDGLSSVRELAQTLEVAVFLPELHLPDWLVIGGRFE